MIEGRAKYCVYPAVYAEAIAQTLLALTALLIPAEVETGTITPTPDPDVAAMGDLDTIQRIFDEKNFTDGLPIIPPTPEKVAQMLTGTSHAADDVVSTEFFPEGLQVTIRQVAINAVMAGCLPAHLPVLLATIEAYQSFHLMNSQLRSTNSFAFMQMVNGSIARELEMNASHNALGPGNRANSTMGRALRLFIINLGRGIPGGNVFAVQGNPAANTFMFAENEGDSPWEPLSVDQGFETGESTLSFFSDGWSHMGNYMVGVPYSSGTTGLPKGVRLSHRNLVVNLDQNIVACEFQQGEVSAAFLPFFHIYGMNVVMNCHLALGTLVTMPRFDLEQFLGINQDYKCRRMWVVPPVALALAKHPMVDEFDLSHLELVLSGAAPCGAELSQAIATRLNALTVQSYGMTKMSPVSHLVPGSAPRDGSSGLTVPNTLCPIRCAGSWMSKAVRTCPQERPESVG
jgi:hypothetical protein